MQRALALAAKGLGKTSPNPMVGAVAVKNGEIIGEGYHHKAGKEHAEVLALKNLSPPDLNDTTLYVTLEPCVLHANKKTPACTDLLIKKGIKSIFIAVTDPNPAVQGKGIRLLKKAGIKVKLGLLGAEAEKLNEVFCKSVASPLPFVILKMASSLDGKIATIKGDSKWITNELSRKYVHTLRSSYDAILTSSTTVLRDNPHLGVRMVSGKDPLRVIIDRELKTSPDALVYRDSNVIVVTTKKASRQQQKKFQKANIRVKIYSSFPSLRTILKDLKKEQQIISLMIETGSTLAASFIKAQLIDKYIFFIAPLLIGEEGKNAIGPLSIKKISSGLRLQHVHYQLFDDNVMIEGYPPHR